LTDSNAWEGKELADARAVKLITKDEEIEKLQQTIRQMKALEDEQDVQLDNLKCHATQLKKQVEEQLLEMCANEYIIDEFKETVNDQKLLVDSKEGEIEREQKKVAQLERELRLKESELVDAKRDLEAKEKELVAWKKLVDEVCPERVPFEKIPPILHSQFQVITICHDIFYISDYLLA
jgi:chromosome segregation ATPase